MAEQQPNHRESTPVTAALRRAAEDATRAPSVLNTQPWRWQIHDDVLELHADPARQLTAIDPEGRLLTLSCGAALHHARVSLAAAGHEAAVERLPDPDRPLLLARVVVGPPRPAAREDLAAYESIRRRRTERRPFGSTAAVTADSLAVLRAAAEAQHARLHRIRPGDLDYLRYAARAAHTIEAKEERHLAEQRAWTHRGPHAADGISPGTVAASAPRPVPLRDFALDHEAALEPGRGDDRGAEYLVLATDRDGPVDWLIAGEAASAAWLAATAQGLAASPMSEVVEIAGARALLASLIDRPGHPQLVLRVGVDPDRAPHPASPRRPPGDVINS
ncbi:Acg family FMN-binding oxidoreductase [Dactylosporangium sp. CA-139066]|uniref:Acg family FMN-binding oxidoreductase n=1 Tax=Dactylosporangium sp. CA-139066 TaxID=3239930 RepID=UPI003D8DE49C